MAWAHPIAAIVVKLTSEKGFSIAMGIRSRLRLLHELALDAVPDLLFDDRWVQAIVDLPLMARPSDIDGIREDPVDVASADQAATVALPVPRIRTGKRMFSTSRAALSRTALPTSR
jgi:hypothetical protein